MGWKRRNYDRKKGLMSLLDINGRNSIHQIKKITQESKHLTDSGLVYWVQEDASGVNIGYSTTQQQENLEKYKVKGDLQPGDLIFTTRHVVMYIGDGKIVQSKNKFKYPEGGIHEQPIGWYAKGVAYRPIDYINEQNNKK